VEGVCRVCGLISAAKVVSAWDDVPRKMSLYCGLSIFPSLFFAVG